MTPDPEDEAAGAPGTGPVRSALPSHLAEIVDDFRGLSERDRLQLLLEFSDELPELPARYADRAGLEQVVECQSPVFLTVELGPGPDPVTHLYVSAPPEAPTTRGFAGILTEGLAGATASEVLAVPDDVPHELGLEHAISPLRLRGMGAMIFRTKRRVALGLRDGSRAAS